MLVVQQSDVQSACAIAIIGQLAPVKTEVVLTRVRALDAYVQIDVLRYIRSIEKINLIKNCHCEIY